jgi:hypothetical protein
VHDKIRDNLCDKCDYKCSSKSELSLHVKAVHNKIRDYKCSQCDYLASQSSHLTTDVKSVHINIRPHKCSQCKFLSVQRSELTQHVRNVHEKIKNHKCLDCDRPFALRFGLLRHMKIVHAKSVVEKPETFQAAPEKPHHEIKSNLRKHVTALHEGIRDHQSAQCLSKAAYKDALKKQVKNVHDKITDKQCQQCDYKCSFKSKLSLHVKAVHDKIRDYKCPQCNYLASQSNHLTMHVKAVHGNICHHKCLQCKFSSVQRSGLYQHVKNVHDKIKDHKCPNCDRAFALRFGLVRHMRVVHAKSGVHGKKKENVQQLKSGLGKEAEVECPREEDEVEYQREEAEVECPRENVNEHVNVVFDKTKNYIKLSMKVAHTTHTKINHEQEEHQFKNAEPKKSISKTVLKFADDKREEDTIDWSKLVYIFEMNPIPREIRNLIKIRIQEIEDEEMLADEEMTPEECEEIKTEIVNQVQNDIKTEIKDKPDIVIQNVVSLAHPIKKEDEMDVDAGVAEQEEEQSPRPFHDAMIE